MTYNMRLIFNLRYLKGRLYTLATGAFIIWDSFLKMEW